MAVILLLYHHYLRENAPTIREYVTAIRQYSRFPVVAVNTELGFPSALQTARFQGIVLHYSLFGRWPYELNKRFYDYLRASRHSHKVAIFQDEYRYCPERFRFIREYGIDTVLTCISPRHVPEFYGKYTPGVETKTVLTGYVSDDLMRAAEELYIPDEKREIDISYRGRPLPFYMGKGAQEKVDIARRFLARAQGTDLRLDIKTAEEDRVYGEAWYRLLANSRGVLGVESGVSFSDVDGSARRAVAQYLKAHPRASFEDVHREVLASYEGRIPIRTISPRHFEAAAFRVCQILYEGEYAGIMQPMVHYLPLKKDFSNFDEIVALFRNPDVRRQLAERTYQDLIASRRYHYRILVDEIDRIFLSLGLVPARREIASVLERQIEKQQRKWVGVRRAEMWLRSSAFFQRGIKPVAKPVLSWLGFYRE